MSTGSILSILAYPQYGYHLVCHTGLSLVHCSYLSVGSLQQHAPPADIQEAAAQIAEDPVVEYLSMARCVPHALSHLSQISEFLRNIPYVFFFYLLT